MSLFYLFSCVLTDTGHPLPWITGREGENEEKDVQTEEKEWRGTYNTTHPLFQHFKMVLYTPREVS